MPGLSEANGIRHEDGIVVSRVNTRDGVTSIASKGFETGRPPLLLLHAIGLDWRMWKGVMLALPDDVPAVALDLPGFGAAGDRLVPPIEMQADELVELMDTVGIQVAHVVGLSYGGVIAQALALSHPERIATLALVATLARPPRQILLARAAEAEAGGPRSYVPPTLHRWFTDEACRGYLPGVRYARQRLYATSVASWAAGWRALAESDYLERLPQIEAPALVVAGDCDLMSTPETMRVMADRLPRSTYRVLTGAAHMIALEHPNELASELAAHVHQTAATPSGSSRLA